MLPPLLKRTSKMIIMVTFLCQADLPANYPNLGQHRLSWCFLQDTLVEEDTTTRMRGNWGSTTFKSGTFASIIGGQCKVMQFVCDKVFTVCNGKVCQNLPSSAARPIFLSRSCPVVTGVSLWQRRDEVQSFSLHFVAGWMESHGKHRVEVVEICWNWRNTKKYPDFPWCPWISLLFSPADPLASHSQALHFCVCHPMATGTSYPCLRAGSIYEWSTNGRAWWQILALFGLHEEMVIGAWWISLIEGYSVLVSCPPFCCGQFKQVLLQQLQQS